MRRTRCAWRKFPDWWDVPLAHCAKRQGRYVSGSDIVVEDNAIWQPLRSEATWSIPPIESYTLRLSVKRTFAVAHWCPLCTNSGYLGVIRQSGQFLPLYVQYQVAPHVVTTVISAIGPAAWGAWQPPCTHPSF